MVTQDLIIRRFLPEYRHDYAAWFADPWLDRYLGPVWDDPEFAQVMADPHGGYYCLWAASSMVAVVGICFATSSHPTQVITDIAVKPALRKTGIGRASLSVIICTIPLPIETRWGAWVEKTNPAAQGFFAACGWHCTEQENGMGLFVPTVAPIDPLGKPGST